MEYKSINKYLKKSDKVIEETIDYKKYIKIFLIKVLICVVIFISVLIAIKMNKSYKEIIYKNVYDSNFSFAKLNSLYKEYFGNILPFEEVLPNANPVFSEKISYKSSNVYKDGVLLSVEDNYLVPALESGIVVYIGEREEYGKVVIVQQVNGVDVWYGNVSVGEMKVYDYVEKGSLVGEVVDNEFYMVFMKDGKFLDYKEYI